MDDNRKIEPEIDYDAVIKNPIRLFGMVYFIFLGAIVIGGYFWVDTLSTITRNSVEAVSFKMQKFEDIPMKNASVLAGVNVAELSVPNDSLVEAGKELYNANCASCHGESGNGEGAAGAALNPKPRNFTSSDGWVNGRNISGLFKTLEEGIIQNGMASYSYMPVDDRFAMIHYIRTFAGDYPTDSKEELEELDMNYKLSEGRATSNQIPVATAIKKVADETAQGIGIINTISKKLDQPDNEAALLFNDLSVDKEKVLWSFYHNDEWKKGTDSFISVVSNSIQQNGFCSSILLLPREKWQLLYNFMIGIYS